MRSLAILKVGADTREAKSEPRRILEQYQKVSTICAFTSYLVDLRPYV